MDRIHCINDSKFMAWTEKFMKLFTIFGDNLFRFHLAMLYAWLGYKQKIRNNNAEQPNSQIERNCTEPKWTNHRDTARL